MTRCALYIPTTHGFSEPEGQVQVLGIGLIGGKFSLALTERSDTALVDYHGFIESGIAGGLFSPPDSQHWRLVLSSTVDAGKSGQLGVFLAHAIHAAPQHQLITDLDEADVVLWASGEVRLPEGNIAAVDSITEKLAGCDAPNALLDQWRTRKLLVKWVLHKDNATQLRAIVGKKAEIVEISHINELPDKLGLPLLHKANATHSIEKHELAPQNQLTPEPKPEPKPVPPAFPRRAVVILAGVALLALAAVVMLSRLPSKPTLATVPITSPVLEPVLKIEPTLEPEPVAEPKQALQTAVSNIQVIELQAAPGKESCASVWAGNAKPRLQTLTTLTPDHPKQNITLSTHFCGLRLSRQTTTNSQQHAWLCEPPQRLRAITWEGRRPSSSSANSWQSWYEHQTTAKLILTLTAAGCVSIR